MNPAQPARSNPCCPRCGGQGSLCLPLYPSAVETANPFSASLPSGNKATSLLRMVLGNKFIDTTCLCHLPFPLTLPKYLLLVSTVVTKVVGPQKGTGSRGVNRQCCSLPGMRLCFRWLPEVTPWPCSETADIAVSKRSFPSAWFVFSPWPVQRGKRLNDGVGNFWANRLQFNGNRSSVLLRNLQQEHILIPPVASEGTENITVETQHANLHRKTGS